MDNRKVGEILVSEFLELLGFNDLVTYREAANLYSVSVSQLKYLVYKGTLNKFCKKHAVLLRKKEIEFLIEHKILIPHNKNLSSKK